MKLNTRARYACMALSDLAAQKKGTYIPLKDMAARQGLSLTYLEQLFAVLKRKGLVTSTRGLYGGYALARPAQHISVAQIMDALDESVRLTRCKGSGAVGTGCMKNGALCATHHVWEGLEKHIHNYMAQTTLAMISSHTFVCPGKIAAHAMPTTEIPSSADACTPSSHTHQGSV